MTEHESQSSSSGSRSPGSGETAVVAEFDSFNDLLDRCASRICEEGLLVSSESDAELGSTLKFELRIRDGFCVLAGAGEVVQAGRTADSDSTHFDVAVRFVDLDMPSLKLLPRLIEHYRKRGMALLDLPPGPVPQTAERTISEPVEPAPLTLDDLEAELTGHSETSGEAGPSEQEGADIVIGEVPGDLLVEAEDVVQPDPRSGEVSEEFVAEDEIRVEDLMSGQDSEFGSDVLVTPPELEGPPIDPGLPWLPDETETKKRSDLWLILLLAIVGALLGVGFYYFYLNRDEGSRSDRLDRDTMQTSPESAVLPEPPPSLVTNDPSETELTDALPLPLTRVDRITWDSSDRETVVVLWADGDFQTGRFEAMRVDEDPPREVIKILDVSQPFTEDRLQIGTDHVRQIRTAIHQGVEYQELHVVADLVDSSVELQRTEADGTQLRVYFSRS